MHFTINYLWINENPFGQTLHRISSIMAHCRPSVCPFVRVSVRLCARPYVCSYVRPAHPKRMSRFSNKFKPVCFMRQCILPTSFILYAQTGWCCLSKMAAPCAAPYCTDNNSEARASVSNCLIFGKKLLQTITSYYMSIKIIKAI